MIVDGPGPKTSALFEALEHSAEDGALDKNELVAAIKQNPTLVRWVNAYISAPTAQAKAAIRDKVREAAGLQEAEQVVLARALESNPSAFDTPTKGTLRLMLSDTNWAQGTLAEAASAPIPLTALRQDLLREVQRQAHNARLKDLPEFTKPPELGVTVAFLRSDANLFEDGASVADARQRGYGTCTILESAAALANAVPEFLESGFKDHGDGTYSVRFFKKNRDGTAEAVWVPVDNELPVALSRNGEKPIWVGAVSKGHITRAEGPPDANAPLPELWPAILEKAHLQFNRVKSADGYGGQTDIEALFQLTGVEPQCLAHPRPVSGDRVIRALDQGQPLLQGDQLWAKLKELQKNRVPTLISFGSHPKIATSGLRANHQYSLLDVTDSPEGRRVALADPHGKRITVVAGVFNTYDFDVVYAPGFASQAVAVRAPYVAAPTEVLRTLGSLTDPAALKKL